MKERKAFLLPVIAVTALVLLLSSAAIAAPQDYQFRADRISAQGRVTSVVREGPQYRVILNDGAYTYLVPTSLSIAHDLRVGDVVRIGGPMSGTNITADYIAFAGEPNYSRDPMYVTVPFGSTGWMSGTVTGRNRHYHFITIRDDATGLPVKIDVRNMDEKRSV